MTDQEQLIELAKLEFPDCDIVVNGLYDQIEAWKGREVVTIIKEDRYNSLDAIVPMIEKQPKSVIKNMEDFLEEFYFDWCWLRLTPRQLCEALLRATDKYKD